jgi:hypothetical protein
LMGRSSEGFDVMCSTIARRTLRSRRASDARVASKAASTSASDRTYAAGAPAQVQSRRCVGFYMGLRRMRRWSWAQCAGGLGRARSTVAWHSTTGRNIVRCRSTQYTHVAASEYREG